MSRKDNILGFNLVELPRTGIKPLQLLHKYNKNKVEKIGTLLELFPRNTLSLPAIKTQKTPNNISDSFSLNMDMQAKMELFSRMKYYFKGAKLSAEANINDEFMIVAENGIIKEISSLHQLNNYINDAKLTANLTNYEKALKKGDIFIITSLLTCKKFAITLVDKKRLGLHADTEISNIASLKAGLERSKATERLIVHEGEDDLVIGFKAHKLRYDKKFWQSKDQAKYSLVPVDHIAVLSDEHLPVEAFTTENGCVLFAE